VTLGDSPRAQRKSGSIGLTGLAVFSLPVLLFQAVELAWRSYLPAFLTQTVGMTLALVGALMLGVRVLDALADVVLGWVSDMVPTRFGRRAPWMVVGAVLVPLGALLLLLSPPGAGLGRVIGASLLLHMGYSFIVTPHGGWGLELSDDKGERTRIMGAKVWFGVIGAIGMLALIGLLEGRFGFDIRALAMVLGTVIAAAAPVTVLAVVAMFREPGPVGAARPRGSPIALARDMMRDPDLRRILLLYLLCGTADAATAGTFLFLVGPVLGLTGQAALFMLIQPVMTLFMLPIWAKVADRIGRRRVLGLGFGWQALVMPLALTVPSGNAVLFGLFLALRGLTCGVDYMLLRAMVADVAERGGARRAELGAKLGASQGPRSSASYYALSSVTLKLALGMGGGLGLWLIGAAGFQAGGRPDAAAGLAVRLAFVLPSVAAGLGGLVLLGGARFSPARSLLRRGAPAAS
jgi:Na+/melibiose symporter-like transporter